MMIRIRTGLKWHKEAFAGHGIKLLITSNNADAFLNRITLQTSVSCLSVKSKWNYYKIYA